MNVTIQAVAQLADQLVDLGLLERVPDPKDRRAKLVRPTRAARRGYAAGRRILLEIHDSWRRQLGEEQYEALERAVIRLQEMHQGGGSRRTDPSSKEGG